MAGSVLCVSRRGALDELARLIDQAQQSDPLAPVTIVVPTARAARLLPRRLLGRRSGNDRPGLVNVEFLTLARLAEVLGAPALSQAARRHLSRTMLSAAIRSYLEEHPGTFGSETAHPATAAEITERYEELRFAGALGDVVSGGAVSRRAASLLRACGEVRRALEKSSYDDVDLLQAAGDAARGEEHLELGVVVLYLPERVRSIEAEFLRALGDHHRVVVVSAQVGGSGGPADHVFAVEVVEDEVIEEGDRSDRSPDVLVRAPGPRQEVHEALRFVLDALDGGTAPDEVAVLYAVRDPYLRILVSELDAIGVPYAAADPNPLSASVPGLVLLTLVELATGPLRRDALMELLRAGTILDSGGAPVDVGEWDRLTRLIGLVDAPIDRWIARLESLAASSLEPGEAGSDTLPSRRWDARRNGTAARDLTHFLRDLSALLSSGREASGWAQLCSWASASLDRLIGTFESWAAWPERARRAGETHAALLSQLAELDAVEPEVSLVQFGQRLAEALRRPGPRIGRLSSGLIVGPIDQLLGVDVELVVVLGASASNLPSGAGRSPLLEANDRAALGLEPLTSRQAAERAERSIGLVRASARRFVMTCPHLEEGGRVAIVSRFATGAALERQVSGELGGLRAVAEGATALSRDEFETALLFSVEPSASPDRASRIGRQDLVVRLQAEINRERGVFGVYSGLVGPGSHPALGPFSPTTLEVLATCPFRHFLDHVLGCEALDRPERRLAIDPRDRGTIVHEVLETYVRTTSIEPLSDTERAALLDRIATEVFERFERLGKTGKRVSFELERRRMLEVLEEECVLDEAECAASGSRPVLLEHGFGYGEVPPVTVKLADRSVSFRGRIDRIDQASDGSLTVLDYKTGRPDRFRAIVDDPVDGGRHLQLPIYALAARDLAARDLAARDLAEGDIPVRANYRFVGSELRELGIVLDERVETRLAEALDVLTQLVESGTFPMQPGPAEFRGPANCHWCDFDSVCPIDRQRLAAGAVASGRLQRLLELVGDESVEGASS